MFERMLDKSINPQYSDLVGFCGTQGEMFDRFNDWVRTNFETDAEINSHTVILMGGACPITKNRN